MAVDLPRLDALLLGIGWTRQRMENATGVKIDADMSDGDKAIVWRVLQAPKESAMALAIWRREFPEAVITCVRWVATQRQTRYTI